jgi:hypothetical protein
MALGESHHILKKISFYHIKTELNSLGDYWAKVASSLGLDSIIKNGVPRFTPYDLIYQ